MIVLDGSFFLSHIFEDENDPLVTKAFEAIRSGEEEGIAPSIFFYEIHNSLLTGLRRRRIAKSQLAGYVNLFALAPVTIFESGSADSILKLGTEHDLSFYDAAYLEMAKLRNAPLATLDGKLRYAAEKEGLAYSG